MVVEGRAVCVQVPDESLQHSLPCRDVNGVFALVHGIDANDQIEGMLAVQMVATHFAATRALRRLKGSDMVSQQRSSGEFRLKHFTGERNSPSERIYPLSGSPKATLLNVARSIKIFSLPAPSPASWVKAPGKSPLKQSCRTPDVTLNRPTANVPGDFAAHRGTRPPPDPAPG